ncbi:MAG: hypothetical protein IKE23_11350 [Exiguobacterium sp.]|nr:hypothetical protein [Exiguobacterium sp.]MBR2741616.1 hypothetical protein [Candidatus Saccharibacteria bacterium]
MKQKQKSINKDFWLWFGGASLILILIISFLAIPYANNNSGSQIPTETTKPTTKTETTKTETTNSEPTSETTETPEPTPTPTPASTPESSPEPAQTPAQTYTTPSTTSSCHHEEAGRCWDDLEDEAYSAGQYDRQFGYYGATLEYADDCNALCREIIEDAYDEGWYDF